MKLHALLATAVAGTLLVHGEPQAQDNSSADLQDLLRHVQQGRTRDDHELRARLRAFEQQPQQEQTRLLRESRERLQTEERRSEQLETRFEDNALSIREVQTRLDESLGELRELFGVLQQASSDARARFQDSATSIEYPDRAEFLTAFAQKMASQSQLPSIMEIERLWYELQREATELGRVKRLPDFRVVTAQGEERFEEIVRVGAFNLVAEGRYLLHNPATTSVSELQRQPSARRFVRSTRELLRADADENGFVRFGVDTTRGQLLSQLVASPSTADYIEQGRLPGYVIIGLGILGLLISLERLITLTVAGRRVSAQLERAEPRSDNPLGRILSVYQQNTHANVETLELKLGEAILKEIPPLQRGILFIKIISVVAPLLGLLGTVYGMIVTFQAITLYGTGDPRIMADGISTALVTTVLGLTVAIPMVLLHTLVNGRSRRIIQILQEQSAGIVAAQADKADKAR